MFLFAFAALRRALKGLRVGGGPATCLIVVVGFAGQDKERLVKIDENHGIGVVGQPKTAVPVLGIEVVGHTTVVAVMPSFCWQASVLTGRVW